MGWINKNTYSIINVPYIQSCSKCSLHHIDAIKYKYFPLYIILAVYPNTVEIKNKGKNCFTNAIIKLSNANLLCHMRAFRFACTMRGHFARAKMSTCLAHAVWEHFTSLVPTGSTQLCTCHERVCRFAHAMGERFYALDSIIHNTSPNINIHPKDSLTQALTRKLLFEPHKFKQKLL